MNVRILFAIGLIGVAAAATTAKPCLMETRTPTYRQELANAAIVVHGVCLASGKANNTEQWITPLQIKSVLKNHAIIDKAKIINLEREISTQDREFLVFFDIHKNKPDAYRGENVTPAALGYIQKIAGLKGKKEADNLRFFFDYLNHADHLIAQDALREFNNASYKDLAILAKNLPADKIAANLETLLKEEFLRNQPINQFALLLGLTGQEKYAPLLRKILEGTKDSVFFLDGFLVAYLQTAPKEGWDYLLRVAGEKDNFMRCYSALRAARILREEHAKLWSKQKRDELTDVFLAQKDIVDFWIEDLRKSKDWDLTDKVLAVWSGMPEPPPIVKRAIGRFALQSPAPAAREFIRQVRMRDPDWVSDTEEILALEDPPKK